MKAGCVLKAMRDEFSQRRSRTGTASLTIQSSDNSGKIVVEADKSAMPWAANRLFVIFPWP